MLHRLRLTSGFSSVVALSITIVVLLGGCSGAAQADTLHLARGAAPAATGTPGAHGIAPLKPQPSGTATLTWDPSHDNTLTVTLAPTGLAPMSPSSYHSDPYPATLGSGNCQQQGNMMHHLTAVKADQYGA